MLFLTTMAEIPVKGRERLNVFEKKGLQGLEGEGGISFH